MNKVTKGLKIAYFGGEPLGVPVLDILKAHDLAPSLIVCSPDRPSGRKMQMTEPPVKTWALRNDIPVFQPESLKERSAAGPLASEDWDLFVVVAYNHILPEWLIETPAHKTLNLHPSMLPALRGPSPIRSAILNDDREAVGVSVMLMDREMDHGPVLAQEHIGVADQDWPTAGRDLDNLLARRGGNLLADTICEWVEGRIVPQPQQHEYATYTKKMTKDMGQLDIDPLHLPTGQEAKAALLKIRGLDGWPGTYFFFNDKRIKINDASIDHIGTLNLLRVTPEGKREMSFDEYLNTHLES